MNDDFEATMASFIREEIDKCIIDSIRGKTKPTGIIPMTCSPEHRVEFNKWCLAQKLLADKGDKIRKHRL